jgi:catechol 2,3-dioxygenase-like lactoylglutathione lyase family enzyme
MSATQGPPKGGFAPMEPEILVSDLEASLAFWRDLIGFEVAYARMEDRFVYLDRDGAQIMLCERWGGWETGPLEPPYGRGVMFQVYVAALAPILERLQAAPWPLHTGLREAWRACGDREIGQREFFVQDPDGYLLMIAEDLGGRPFDSLKA